MKFHIFELRRMIQSYDLIIAAMITIQAAVKLKLEELKFRPERDLNP